MTTGEKIMDTIQVLIVAGVIYAIVYNAENSEKQRMQRYELWLT